MKYIEHDKSDVLSITTYRTWIFDESIDSSKGIFFFYDQKTSTIWIFVLTRGKWIDFLAFCAYLEENQSIFATFLDILCHVSLYFIPYELVCSIIFEFLIVTKYTPFSW